MVCANGRGRVWRTAAVAFVWSWTACASAPRSSLRATTPDEALTWSLYEASHPCPDRKPTTTVASEPAPELLVEALLLDAPLNPAIRARTLTLEQLVDLPGLQLLASPKFSSKFDTPSSLTREQHFGVLEKATLSRTSLVARRGANDRSLIELELSFSLPNANPASNPQLSSVAMVLEGPYGEPALSFAEHPADPQRVLVAVVSTYPMRTADDRRAVFECKMRLYQRAREQR